MVDSPRETRKGGPIDVTVSAELTDDQCNDVHVLLDEFSDVLSDLPGLTTLGVHQIKLTSDKPIRRKPYPLPFTSRETVCEEVRKMPFEGPYYSPIVIVKKKDGTNRFCIDFRAINTIIVFDAETIPNADDIFIKLAGCKYVSKFDLSKGYWQLP